jgi:hypothetical protein
VVLRQKVKQPSFALTWDVFSRPERVGLDLVNRLGCFLFKGGELLIGE